MMNFIRRWPAAREYPTTRSRKSKGGRAVWQRCDWEHQIRDEEDWRRHEWVARLGQGPTECATLVRLIGIQVGGSWHHYPTSMLDAQRQPVEYMAQLYGQ
jgi:hypothetical protein